MAGVVNVNGRITDERDAVVSVLDHGFVYGEGVYEVLRTYSRQPFLFAPHMRRLRESAARIALDLPWSDAELLDRVRDTLAASREPGEAYVRILLTRGVGELTYDPKSCPQPTLVIMARPHVAPQKKVFDDGVRVSLVSVMRNHPQALNPLIKSNNLLNNALAMQEALRHGAFEALMKNHRGEISECAQSNFFLVRGREAITPPLDAGLLAGITRAFVIALGEPTGITMREGAIVEDDLRTADEAFLTSTTKEIVPIVAVDDLRIGTGTPGPVTRALMEAFRQRTDAFSAAATTV